MDEVIPTDLAHGRSENGSVSLHYVEVGRPNPSSTRPLVVLLHGFPQFWYSWRHQLAPLAEAGYHVVAPDLRGYNRSDRPQAVEAYRMEHLLADIRSLVGRFDHEWAAVVGHDWGGAIVYETAVRDPDLFDRQVVLNFPHPGPYKRAVLSPAQLRRSWYVGFFMLPWLPEALLRRDDLGFMDTLFRDHPVRPDAFTEADIRRYKDAMATPGALTAALNYYRALIPQYSTRLVREELPWLETTLPETTTEIVTPTMLIWGEQDRTLVPDMANGLSEWIPECRVHRLPDASHWVHEDRPTTVTELLLEFL